MAKPHSISTTAGHLRITIFTLLKSENVPSSLSFPIFQWMCRVRSSPAAPSSFASCREMGKNGLGTDMRWDV